MISSYLHRRCSLFFFFNDTATTEIYTLSLHDALPISMPSSKQQTSENAAHPLRSAVRRRGTVALKEARSHAIGKLLQIQDRKSTRLNSSHSQISYAVFCLKKKKK